MQQAVRWQILARNPVDAVDPPKIERGAMTTYDLLQTADLIWRLPSYWRFFAAYVAAR
jgi:hypothetical protein